MTDRWAREWDVTPRRGGAGTRRREGGRAGGWIDSAFPSNALTEIKVGAARSDTLSWDLCCHHGNGPDETTMHQLTKASWLLRFEMRLSVLRPSLAEDAVEKAATDAYEEAFKLDPVDAVQMYLSFVSSDDPT